MASRAASSSSGGSSSSSGVTSSDSNSTRIKEVKEHDEYSARKVSDVWKYFTKTPDRKKAVCSLCDREFAYSGGTTNLRDHLSAKHSLQYSTASKPTTERTTLDDFVKRTKCSEARAKNITERVSQMIVQDL